MCTHSQAQGSDAASVVPLYLPSTHWQLADPALLVKLCSGQDAHGSLLYPSLNVPLGHSVKRETSTYHSAHSTGIAHQSAQIKFKVGQKMLSVVWFNPAYNTSLRLEVVHLYKVCAAAATQCIQCIPAEPVIGLVECCHSAHTTTTHCP